MQARFLPPEVAVPHMADMPKYNHIAYSKKSHVLKIIAFVMCAYFK